MQVTVTVDVASSTVPESGAKLPKASGVAVTVQLSPAARQLPDQLKEKIYWLVITENWCGDSAQSTPIMEKFVEASNGKIEMRFIYRDTNLELMNAHLTGTSQSIPKVIQLDKGFHVIGSWGPRPDKAHQLVLRLKSNPATAHTYSEELHKWYAQDKQVGIETGLLDLVKEAIAVQSERQQPEATP